MVTNLGNIQTPPSRHAENADARLDIRRHDPEQEQRKKDERDTNKGPVFDTYDNAVISLDSLRVFLLNFLSSLIEIAQKNTHFKHDSALQAAEHSPDENQTAAQAALPPQAARAASAYQSAARTAPPVRSASLENTDADASDNKREETLDNEEIREIHALLADIDRLMAKGIASITIEQDETFVKSLAAAVTKALNS
jgi:hypothetical protein